mgnify:CR=1 FL=1
MTETRDADHFVRVWYGDTSRLAPQGKTAEWPDRVLLDQGALIDGKDVLNLGCFYPEDEEALAHRAGSWIAIDFIPGIVNFCRALRVWPSWVTFEVRDMRALKLEYERFDVVTDFSSGDHLPLEDWHRVIDEAYRVLRPGGHFLVCFANNPAFVKILGDHWRLAPAQFGEYGYVRTDTPEAMREMLEERGFEVVRESHCNDSQLRAGMLARKT